MMDISNEMTASEHQPKVNLFSKFETVADPFKVRININE